MRWVAVVVAAMLTGCASGGGAVSSPTGSPSAGAGGTDSRTATFADNGTDVAITVGGTLTVTLPGTYWQFAPIAQPDVLSAGRPIVIPGSKHAVPGAGAGTLKLVLRGRSVGSAVVSATRRSCGEALRCTPQQSRFRLTVRVRS